MKVNSEGVSSSRVYLPADKQYPSLLEFFIHQFPHQGGGKDWGGVGEPTIAGLQRLQCSMRSIVLLASVCAPFL
ncbi:hypothetical protein [Polynucleobacter necessarius]|uniref:hypothetical protein n=1 Tax=Polynucleobacter necessarius TaxID=576610 RepID=UPI0018D4FC48|nr:hypothetical protein [Polynucleobacter necessarius]